MWGIHSTQPSTASPPVPKDEEFKPRLDGSSPDLSLCGWIPHYKVITQNEDGSWSEQILRTWVEVRTASMNARIEGLLPPIVTLMFNLPPSYL